MAEVQIDPQHIRSLVEIIEAIVDNRIRAVMLAGTSAAPQLVLPGVPAPQPRRGRPAGQPKAPKPSGRAARIDVAAMADKVMGLIADNANGVARGDIMRHYSLTGAQASHVVQRLRDDKKIVVRGDKRAAKYYPAGSAAPAEAKTNGKAKAKRARKAKK